MATISTTVVMPLPQLENRFLRAQPSGAGVVDRGGELRALADGQTSVMAQRSLSAMRLLYQFMKAEIDRLTDR